MMKMSFFSSETPVKKETKPTAMVATRKQVSVIARVRNVRRMTQVSENRLFRPSLFYSASGQQFVQMQVHRPQTAAIVPGGYANDAVLAGCPHADARGLLDRGGVQPIDDDLVNRIDGVRQSRFHQAAQGRTVGVVGAGTQFLVAAP